MTVKFAACRHCGRLLWRINDEPEKWIHFLPDRGFWGSVSCRAASFAFLGDWDDSLDDRWKASPDKRTIGDTPEESEARASYLQRP